MQCGLASKQILKAIIQKYICTQKKQEMHTLRKHKLMISSCRVMEILSHFYSCEKINITSIKSQQNKNVPALIARRCTICTCQQNKTKMYVHKHRIKISIGKDIWSLNVFFVKVQRLLICE